MLLLLTLLLLLPLAHATTKGNVHNLTVTWLRRFAEDFPGSPCLKNDQEDELVHCFVATNWHIRTDGQRELPPSECDLLLTIPSDEWSPLEKTLIMACVHDRLIMEYLRALSPMLVSVPQDLLTNPYRKYYYAMELGRAAAVYWQYFADSRGTLESFQETPRRQLWVTMGLNVSHYERVTSEAELKKFRATHTVEDYFSWSNASHLDTIVWLLRWDIQWSSKEASIISMFVKGLLSSFIEILV